MTPKSQATRLNRRTWVRALSALPLVRRAQAFSPAPATPRARHARIPQDTPLNAVQWTSGFWRDRMRRLRETYIPGVLDGSFLDLANGSSFRNFLRAAGVEPGGALGRLWSDGDCYFVLDTMSRLYAHGADDYLKTKLGYWVSTIDHCRSEDGMVDTWSRLGKFDDASAKLWDSFDRQSRMRKPRFQGGYSYTIGHLYPTAVAHSRATGDRALLEIADKALLHYIEAEESGRPSYDLTGHIASAYALRYSLTGEERFLAGLQRANSRPGSVFGPPLREAVETFGHGTQTSSALHGATALYGFTGERAVLDALTRLADDMLSAKVYITGAVAPVAYGERPVRIVGGKTYPSARMNEAVGEKFNLPNDSAYCESCAGVMYTEWFYRMFRATGHAVYMDAVERAMYNFVPGCVDLERANFFYCNPQEQGPGSTRRRASEPEAGAVRNYTWRRTHTKQAACCPPKVMRGIAMSAPMAYAVNNEGVWVNLYGANSARLTLPSGGAVELRQVTGYPWDGKVRLVLTSVKSEKPFRLFLRIPAWVRGPVTITVNGKAASNASESGVYRDIERRWKSGDRVEMHLPMPVRLVAAHPNIADDRGKVAVARGPVVYCLEGDDIPDGTAIEKLFVPGGAKLDPVFSSELGGVVKLTGELIHSTTAGVSADKLVYDPGQTALYGEARFAKPDRSPAAGDHHITLTLVPYYARLNRKSDYFRIWIPVY